VIRYGVRKQPWALTHAGIADRRPLMRAEVKREAAHDRSLWHPLFRGDAEIEPCKFTQAYHFAFGAANGHVPGMEERVQPCVAPLLSQPLMELSLRIPAYVLTNGGRDRAVARAAFAAELPPEILRRRAKGTGNGFLEEVIWRHIDSARELLLDGFLVSAGFVDRARLEAVLSGGPTRVGSGVVELAIYLDVEKWVQSQRAAPLRAVA
jgi:asparagine synthase (glutamine-hydrolysing)